MSTAYICEFKLLKYKYRANFNLLILHLPDYKETQMHDSKHKLTSKNQILNLH